MTAALRPQEMKGPDHPGEAKLQRRPAATGFVPFEVSQGAARGDSDPYALAAGIPRLKDRGELFPAYFSPVENLISRKAKRTKGSLIPRSADNDP